MLANVYSSRKIIMVSHMEDADGRIDTVKYTVNNVSTSAPEEKVLAYAQAIKSLLAREIDTIRICETHEYVEIKH